MLIIVRSIPHLFFLHTFHCHRSVGKLCLLQAKSTNERSDTAMRLTFGLVRYISWHYWLALAGEWVSTDDDNICKYAEWGAQKLISTGSVRLTNTESRLCNNCCGGKTIKVKWSRYRPGVAHMVGRGIALLFHDRGTRRVWVVSSTPRPHFTPRKDPVPILQEAGWAPGPVWTGGKSRPTPGFEPGPSSPWLSRYSDWTTRPTEKQ